MTFHHSRLDDVRRSSSHQLGAHPLPVGGFRNGLLNDAHIRMQPFVFCRGLRQPVANARLQLPMCKAYGHHICWRLLTPAHCNCHDRPTKDRDDDDPGQSRLPSGDESFHHSSEASHRRLNLIRSAVGAISRISLDSARDCGLRAMPLRWRPSVPTPSGRRKPGHPGDIRSSAACSIPAPGQSFPPRIRRHRRCSNRHVERSSIGLEGSTSLASSALIMYSMRRSWSSILR